MQLKSLHWQFIGTNHCLWVGKADGLLSHVRFFITAADGKEEEYLIRTEIKSIADEVCIGLEKSKEKAQQLLDSYAWSLVM